jgi:CRISPR-associated endonuclease/helicase Cas3
MQLAAERFPEFFQALHGYEPFPWQQTLVQQLTNPNAEGRWPSCLALPTSSGKTCCLDIAVFVLASQAEWPVERRTAPRRILFVVDRRVIVDEAHSHALALSTKLAEASEGILYEVGSALRRLAGSAQAQEWNPLLSGQPPLTVHSLRGGAYRDEAWALTPTQPCIITSTVDQAGSRLLFRAYGRGSKAWPVLAGLTGNDTLVLLDEAHCSNPFLETMTRVARYRGPDWAESHLASPFQFTVLSATPPAAVRDVYRLQTSDREHPVLQRRLGCSKPARLVVAERASGRALGVELAVELVAQTLPLVTEGRRGISIMVNRVRTAQLVHDLLEIVLGRSDAATPFSDNQVKGLRKQLNDWSKKGEPHLLTGRMRPIDQRTATRGWLETLRANPRTADQDPTGPSTAPLIIVSTQTLEVGANLDFDVLVTECASLDALRQRFGRLNRVGNHAIAPAVIVVSKAQSAASDELDPIYGSALTATWEWLRSQSAAATEPDTIDFGVWSLERRLAELSAEDLAKLVRAGAPAPVLLPAHVDLLTQTAPTPAPSPDLQPFLHGWDTRDAEVQVCWRSDLRLAWLQTQSNPDEAATDVVALCPPTSAECLPVPLPVLQRWLSDNTSDRLDSTLADLSAQPSPADKNTTSPDSTSTRRAFVWRGPEESGWVNTVGEIRPGDTLVLPAETGGFESLGWVPRPSREAIDVGDLCAWENRRRGLVRLHPSLIGTWNSALGAAIPKRQLDGIAQLLGVTLGAPDQVVPSDWEIDEEELRTQLAAVSEGLPDQASWLAQALADISEADFVPHPAGGLVVVGPRPAQPSLSHSVTEWPEPDGDGDAGSYSTAAVALPRHLAGVTRHATHFATILGLSPRLIRSMEYAAKWHDVGKIDPRFQRWLHGGNAIAATLSREMLAKSAQAEVDRRGMRLAARLSELPNGFRHELVSSQLVQSLGVLSGKEQDVDADLVLHLIEAHHGHSRPFAPVVVDDSPPALRWQSSEEPIDVSSNERSQWTPLHRVHSGPADRFWRLVRRYGWWGLAWLESILFLADHRESELESWQSRQARGAGTR